jgi:hypothetical protein
MLEGAVDPAPLGKLLAAAEATTTVATMSALRW